MSVEPHDQLAPNVTDRTTTERGLFRVARGFNPMAPAETIDPYPTYARLRASTPVAFSEMLGMWIVTGYEEVAAIIRDTDGFSSRIAVGTAVPPPEVADVLPDGYPESQPSLVNNDPPAHTRIRRLANTIFKPTAIAAREPQVTAIVDELIDTFIDDGRADLYSALAVPLPLAVISQILGLPVEDAHLFEAWSNDQAALAVDILPHDQKVERARHYAGLFRYAEALIARRRQDPGDDLFSSLVNASDDGGRPVLTDRELVSVFSQLLIAGNETTRYLISSLVHLLLSHPAQLAAVRRDPSLAARAVEEALRFHTSLRAMFRIADRDADIAGARIRAGDVLAVVYGAANHDPAVFAAPDRFDIFRADVGRHIAFSKGTHFCLGAPLARLEARVALQRLLKRLPELRLDEKSQPPEFLANAFMFGRITLPVAWGAS